VERLLSTLHQCATSIRHGVIALAVGFILFSLMERLFVFSNAKKPWRAYLLDLQYAFLSMLYPPFIYFILSIIFGLLALHPTTASHDSQISPILFAAELVAVLFLRDCLIYIRHRIFHTRPVWAFHSIHHSSEEVNWLSAARFHPAENMIESAAEILLFLGCNLMDFDPLVLAVAGLIIGFYNLFIHANLRWTFGPLRYIFVSPVLHRWHHSDAPAAQDKNFAAMFSCIDWAMGTFYMPKDSAPETLGLPPQEKPVHPRTFGKQLLYPFRKR
jgi:sterol desaturase/sphingolipid hydroxylase (fatty acid hydroxylase superfamily)